MEPEALGYQENGDGVKILLHCIFRFSNCACMHVQNMTWYHRNSWNNLDCVATTCFKNVCVFADMLHLIRTATPFPDDITFLHSKMLDNAYELQYGQCRHGYLSDYLDLYSLYKLTKENKY